MSDEINRLNHVSALVESVLPINEAIRESEEIEKKIKRNRQSADVENKSEKEKQNEQ